MLVRKHECRMHSLKEKQNKKSEDKNITIPCDNYLDDYLDPIGKHRIGTSR